MKLLSGDVGVDSSWLSVQDLKVLKKIQCPTGRKISSTGQDDNIIKIEAAL